MAFLEYHSQSKLSSKTRAETGLYANGGKRLTDLIIACLLLPVLSPVIAFLWIMVRCDGGAGFFGHQRIGKDGKAFNCWKLRTMVPEAEKTLELLMANDTQCAKEWAETHKLRNDPRVTRLGHWLRRTSLDELPQLWNVLRGEMSFVGPRPITKPELSFYGALSASYLSARPGITGLWQIEGRGNGCYTQRVKLDVHYGTTKSVWKDLQLILLTCTVVLRATGR